MKSSESRRSVRKLGEELEDGRLDGDVESGGDLVADEQIGVGRERPRDRDALALAARELAREALGETGREPYALEQPDDLGSGIRPGEVAKNPGGARDRITDTVARIERVVRVLEDDLDATALIAGAALRSRAELLAVEEDRARRGRMQAGHTAGDRGLAASGLADEGNAFALGQLERDAVGRDDLLAAASVYRAQPFDREQRHPAGGRRNPGRWRRIENRGSLPFEAAHAPRGSDLDELGHCRVAGLDLDRAARRERAARRPLADPDRDPGHGLEPARVQVVGDRRDETPRVRVLRPGEDVRGTTFLDDPPGVHDGDPVGDLGDDGEIVRHVHHRQAALAAQPVDLVEHASLRHDVEPRRRLVEHDERRLAHERDRDHHALLLAAGELVRVASRELRTSAGRWTLARTASTDPHHARAGRVRVEHVLDRCTDPQRRVQRVARILRHVRDEATAQSPRARCSLTAAQRLARRPRRCRPRAERPAVRSRAAPARSSSCRSRTRRRARGSRPAETSSDTSSTIGVAAGQLDPEIPHRKRRARLGVHARSLASTDRSVRAIESPTRFTDIVSSAIRAAGTRITNGFSVQPVAVLGDHQPPVRVGRLKPEPEEVDGRDEDDREGEA